LLGIGVAFKICYVTEWRRGQIHFLESVLTRAVFFSALLTAVAFGSLWFSNNPGISSMGKLLALSLTCALASAALFQPALMGEPRRPADNEAWHRRGVLRDWRSPAVAATVKLAPVVGAGHSRWRGGRDAHRRLPPLRADWRTHFPFARDKVRAFASAGVNFTTDEVVPVWFGRRRSFLAAPTTGAPQCARIPSRPPRARE
jgi:hypothetical protein